MPDIKSPWPVLAEQAQAKLTEAENVLRQARLKEAEAQSSRERVLNMITEYRAKLTQFERQTNLSDSLNCRQFLAQLVDLDVQAQLRVQQMAAARDLAAEQVRLARVELEKMKKLVERENKRLVAHQNKAEQQRLDEMATMRHGLRHA